jgi:hypothetical protein
MVIGKLRAFEDIFRGSVDEDSDLHLTIMHSELYLEGCSILTSP